MMTHRSSRSPEAETAVAGDNIARSAAVSGGVLPRRRGQVLILGLAYFGQLLAEQLRGRGWVASYAPHPGRSAGGWAKLAPRVARADVLYLISSRIDRWAPQDVMMHLRRKPVVIHWVGTDAMRATEAHEQNRLSARMAERAIHWCDAPWLVEELRRAGIHSEYVGLPIPLPSGAAPPLPKRFSVMLYLPADARDRRVFDEETTLALPEAFPDVPFTLLPATAASLGRGLPPNVSTPGWLSDIDGVYRDSTVVVRQTLHDGMAFTAVEALARGRYVIWNFPIRGAIQASGFEAVARELTALKARHDAGELGINQAGRSYVQGRFGGNKLLLGLDRRLEALIHR